MHALRPELHLSEDELKQGQKANPPVYRKIFGTLKPENQVVG